MRRAGNTFQARGFTLIELLVVISIIGVLSSVVLSSLSSARSKGMDAAIKADLSNLQTQAEIYYYGTGANAYGTVVASDCASNLFTDPTIAKILTNITSNIKGGGSTACYSSKTLYVVQVPLNNSSSNYWCIDNTGARKPEAAVLGGNTSCQ